MRTISYDTWEISSETIRQIIKIIILCYEISTVSTADFTAYYVKDK